MTKQFINFNGEIVPADQPVMTVRNRAFRYGDGLFESMRMINGELKFADLHAERIRKGMKILKIEGHGQVDTMFLRERVADLSRRNKTGTNLRARFTVFRDADGLYSPDKNRMGYALEVIPTDDERYVYNPKGLIIDVFDEVTKPVNALSGIKTCNSLVYVMAGIYKDQYRLDEVVILNNNGFICEAMSSNIFIVYDKKVYTPALNEGCVAGIMRKVTMKLIKENGFELVEAQINPAILHEAQEVFVTNAGKGIQWVLGYDKKRYYNEVSKVLSAKLNQL